LQDISRGLIHKRTKQKKKKKVTRKDRKKGNEGENKGGRGMRIWDRGKGKGVLDDKNKDTYMF